MVVGMKTASLSISHVHTTSLYVLGHLQMVCTSQEGSSRFTCLSTSVSTRRNTGSFLRLMYESRRCTSCCRANLTRSFASGRCLQQLSREITIQCSAVEACRQESCYAASVSAARPSRCSKVQIKNNCNSAAARHQTIMMHIPALVASRPVQQGNTRCNDLGAWSTIATHCTHYLIAAYVCSSRSMLDW